MAGVGKPTGAFGGPRVTAIVGVTFALAALVSSVARAPPPGSLDGARAPASCLGVGLREGTWTRDASACVEDRDAPAAGCDDRETLGAFWSFDAASARCGARAQTRASNAFAGRRVLVVGDSIARHVYASVLRLAALDPEAQLLNSQEKHRDWTHALVDGGVATFRWAPFARNVTATLGDVFDANIGDSSTRTWEVVILGAALWDALHVRSVETYARDVRALAAKLAAIRDFNNAERRKKSASFFWLAAPRVRDDALIDPAKRAHMTDAKVAAYGDAARNTPGFLFEGKNDDEHRWQVLPVDVGALAAGCAKAAGEDENDESDALKKKCFGEDGVHAARAVYDAAAQVIADAVVRETNDST